MKTFTHPIAKNFFDKVSVVGGNVQDKNTINSFTRQLCNVVHPSLWVCWPLRSTQNIGTGSTVYSLGGLGEYPGIMVNGPTWGTLGMDFVRTSSQRVLIDNPVLSGGSAHSIITIAVDVNTANNYHVAMSCGNNRGSEIFPRSNSNTNIAAAAWSFAGVDSGIALDGTYSPLNYFCSINTADSNGYDFWWNGTQYSIGSGNYTINPAATTTPCIGASRVGTATFANYFNGTITFGAIFNVRLTSSQRASIYTILKSTIARGIALP